MELSKKGYNAFALIYRPGAQTACEDLACAIAFLFTHQKELGIPMANYSLWGGSAGVRMAACVGTNDWIASYQAMTRSIQKIKANGSDEQIVIFPGLSHGFGLGEGTVAQGWLEKAISFWQKH